MMKIGAAIWLTAVLFLLFVLTACAPTPTPEPYRPEAIYTAAAQTVEARLTLSAGETAVAQLTQLAAPATATTTSIPASPTSPATEAIEGPVYSPTPWPTPVPTATQTPRPPCDWVLLVGDVSVVDNTSFAPGAAFTKTWRLKNIGTCAWTPDYSLVFYNGDYMSGSYAQPMPGTIWPGDTVDLSVNLVAPTASGTYRSEWMLHNPSGVLFGFGPQASSPFWVQIQVNPVHQSGNFAYDFAANFCAAIWRSGAGVLGCPGTSGSPAGSVVLLSQPDLESTQEDELALWTRPDTTGDGWISGQYPPYRVRSGDRFVSEVGCLKDSRRCEVTFAVDYMLSDGRVRNLSEWEEVYDGDTTSIDMDLSDLAGSSVQFILSVYNDGSAQAADAFWLVPRIEGSYTGSDLVLTWHEEGGPQNECKEVRVYLTGVRRGEAHGYTCRGTVRELGSVHLSDVEARQVTELFNRLKPFESELYSASPGTPLRTWMNFTGAGNAEASNADILNLNNLGNQLYNTID